MYMVIFILSIKKVNLTNEIYMHKIMKFILVNIVFSLTLSSSLFAKKEPLLYQKEIVAHKKAKTLTTKAIAALKKRELSYKKLIRNLERLLQVVSNKK